MLETPIKEIKNEASSTDIPSYTGQGLDEARVADLIIGSFHDKICDPSLSLDWNLCCLSIGGIMKTVPSVYTILINSFYLSLSCIAEKTVFRKHAASSIMKIKYTRNDNFQS